MSKLVHLCTDCRHPKHNLARLTPAADALLATFAFPGGEPEPLHEPGSTRNPHGSAHREPLCDCEACHAAYDHHIAQAG